ncbi:MAG: WXG100 family type VII secretion target [Nocardioides sp.]
MANNTVSTTTPGMQQTETKMEEVSANTKNGRQTVESEWASLKSTWTGEAATTFDRPLNAWLDDCNHITGLLDQMREIMVGNRQIIDAGEDDNIQIANQVQVGPGMPL